MDSSSQKKWDEIAWNGIKISAPKDWQIGVIGKQYLILEEDTCPVMEIKWNKIKGRFSHKDQIRRLASVQKKNVGKTIKTRPIPLGWEKAVKGYQAQAFSWYGKGIEGTGLLLFCQKCKNATLIHFYGRDAEKQDNIHKKILSSFRDHNKQQQINIDIFNIKAVIPHPFQLLRHRFEAGKYELEFTARSQKITFHRWAAASFLLKKRSMLEFSNSWFGLHEKDLSRPEAGNVLEYHIEPASGFGARLYNRIKRKHPFQFFRVWQENVNNSILAVNMEGKKQLNPDLFDRICLDYESN